MDEEKMATSVPMTSSVPETTLATTQESQQAVEITPVNHDGHTPTPRSRQGTVEAEPINDKDAPEAAATTTTTSITPDTSATPALALNLTLMLSTGARHPYHVDEKYLNKRHVTIPGTTDDGRKDPASISVYTLKELILREWREEWEAQPSSPGSIRLIYFGRMLGDKDSLRDCKFHATNPNIVHMAVKPPDMIEEDENAKGKSADRAESSSSNGCRCCVVM